MLIKQIPTWVVETNAWVVATGPGSEAIIVDAPPEPEAVGEYVASLDLTVLGILLTHGHIDHMGGSGRLAALTGALTYVHPDDDFLTLHPTDQIRSMFGMSLPGEFNPPAERQALAHGDLLQLADIAIEVRLTPGHTPGHCCFYVEQEGLLFSGDQLFAGSIGRSDFPYGDFDDLMTSMRTQVMTLDDEVRVLPGHGPETSIGRERRTNPFRHEWGG